MALWSVRLSMASVQGCREGQRAARRGRSLERPFAVSAKLLA